MARVTDITAGTPAITAADTIPLITAADKHRPTSVDTLVAATMAGAMFAACIVRRTPTMAARATIVRDITAVPGVAGNPAMKKGRLMGGPFCMERREAPQSISCTTVRLPGSTSITRLPE